ncbi:MAG: TlpA disulfide reductase family protein [Bacteroidales bacterium]|jgi:peroxiredoxin|nr:TlpA disulfide reductase family protein [Bacteroidales bacterium]NLM93251.1 AhpC/TSA family protein [Bacteroidales bacterium]
MKNNLIFAFVLLLASCQPQERSTYTLNGEISGKTNGYVYLVDRVSGLYQLLDSAEVVDGRFRFSGSLDFPSLYYLEINRGNSPRVAFFMENTEMHLQLNVENPSEFSLAGSPSHDVMNAFSQMAAEEDAKMEILQQQILEAEVLEDASRVESLRVQYQEAENQKKVKIREFIDQHLDKTVGLYLATRNLSYEMDGAELDGLVNSFDSSLAESRYYASLRERADKLLALSVGKVAPEFSLPDADGNWVALSDFRGKYLLVSFWASWCPYCRAENPHLVKIYEQYKDQNFEILGVSLDRAKEPWLKAIADDGLPWTHITDLKGWENEASTLYGVASIPSTILLDPDGAILGRNLSEKELDEMMLSLFGPEV